MMNRVLPAPSPARRPQRNCGAAGVNLDGVDRVVLGDGLAEGKVVSATRELLTFRLDLPNSVPTVGPLLAACFCRQDGSAAAGASHCLGP